MEKWDITTVSEADGVCFSIYKREKQRALVCRIDLSKRTLFIGTAVLPADYEVLLKNTDARVMIGGGFTAFHKEVWHTLGAARGQGATAPRLKRRWPMIYQDRKGRWKISSTSKLADDPEVTQILQSRPRLLYDGKISGNTKNPDVTRAIRHPRAVIGLSKGYAWLIVIEGRMTDALGLTLLETAEFLQEVGVRDALNLDGGGSAVLIMDGHPLNRTSGGLSPLALPGTVRPLLNFIGVQ